MTQKVIQSGRRSKRWTNVRARSAVDQEDLVLSTGHPLAILFQRRRTISSSYLPTVMTRVDIGQIAYKQTGQMARISHPLLC